MISPHTAPGTEIVAVRDYPPGKGLPGLKKGRIYTVRQILQTAQHEDERFCVVVAEHGMGSYSIRPPWWAFWRGITRHRSGWSLSAFRYLDKHAKYDFYAARMPRRVGKKERA